MNPLKYLQAAGVPAHYHAAALASIESARDRASGLLWHKIKVRLFQAGKIAKLLQWNDERLLYVRPDLASWDIAPVINITAHGDNVPWVMTAAGGRPVPGAWLDDSPEARAANYWCEGEHPRSQKSRKAWYRRNGGEYEAWARGVPVNVANARAWHGDGVSVYECSGAWQINAQDKWIGFIPVKVRIGFEISNVWRESDGAQLWFPIPNHGLRAPLTWSVMPGRGD